MAEFRQKRVTSARSRGKQTSGGFQLRSEPNGAFVSTMKPDTRTVTELFERDVRYVVPLYQRPYVWNQKDQWEPLWEDIVVLLDHQVSGSLGPEGAWSHFLGAIVLDQETRAPGSIPVYTLIDGQQRLTTLQVLLAAAANAAEGLGATNDADILRSLTRNRPLKGDR
jgi:hypothetical protein